jgi:hypothetical protein
MQIITKTTIPLNQREGGIHTFLLTQLQLFPESMRKVYISLLL